MKNPKTERRTRNRIKRYKEQLQREQDEKDKKQQYKQFLQNNTDIQKYTREYIPDEWIYGKYIDMFVKLDRDREKCYYFCGRRTPIEEELEFEHFKTEFLNIFELMKSELGEFYIMKIFLKRTKKIQGLYIFKEMYNHFIYIPPLFITIQHAPNSNIKLTTELMRNNIMYIIMNYMYNIKKYNDDHLFYDYETEDMKKAKAELRKIINTINRKFNISI